MPASDLSPLNFQTLLSDAPVPVCIFAGSSLIISWTNPAMLALWHTGGHIVGLPALQALPEMGQALYRHLQQVYQTGSSYEAPEQQIILFKGGEPQTCYLNFSLKPLRSEAGEVYAVISFITDITASILAKRALAENEERTAFALQSAGAGTWSLDPLQGLVTVDEECRRIFGFAGHDQIRYEDTLEFLHPDDAERVNEAVLRALDKDSGGLYDVEYRNIDPAGKISWLRSRGKAYFNEQGAAYRFAGTAVDITESKRKDAAIRNFEGRYEIAFQNAALGVIILDTDSNILLVNKEFIRITGYTQQELYRISFRDITHLDDVVPNMELFNAMLNGETSFYAMEKRYIHKDGHIVWVKLSSALVKNNDDTPDSIISIISDVTEEKRKDEALKNAERRFQTAFNSASVGIAITGMNGGFISVNKAFYELTGCAPQDIEGAGLSDIVQPDDLPRLRSALGKLKGHKTTTVQADLRLICKNDTHVWVNAAFTLVTEGSEAQPYLFAIIKDITGEIEARREQQKLLGLIENSRDFMAVADAAGDIQYVNSSAKELIGLDGDSFLDNRNVADLFLTEQRHRVHDYILPIVMASGQWSGKLVVQHQAGSYIPCYVNFLRVNDSPAGNPFGIGLTMRDLRPELEAQAALTESEVKFRSLIEQAPVAVALFKGPGMEFNVVNHAMYEMLGKTADILGSSILTCMPELRKQGIIKALYQVFETGKPYYGFEIPIRINRDGKVQENYYHITFTPIFEDSEVTGIIEIATEVTEQVNAQQALTNSELLLKNITAASPAALWMTNEYGEFTYINKTWLDWSGLTFEGSLGNRWINALMHEDRIKTLNTLMSALQNRQYFECEVRLPKGDGTIRWCLMTGNPQYNNQRILTGYIGACTDITERKDFERQKDDFLGIASHELKTPVTSLKAYTQVLESIFKKDGDLKKAAMLGKMDNQINRLTALIGDLLDVTKINSGRLQFNPTRFDFNKMVSETIEEMQRTTEKYLLQEELDSTGDVFADRDRIGQVIINFITNAMKYSPDANRIIITAARHDNEMVLSVRDFGIGIHADSQQRVFEQFYRVSGDNQHTFPGLGLGLYISSQIVQREGGRIWVSSQIGEGSTFSFSLPVAD